MPNIPSYSTIVSLKASNVIPVTNYCMAIKLINNTKSNSVGIKSLSGSCDLKIQVKAGSIIKIFIDEGSYRFTGKGNYINCSDKTPEEIRPKDQGFDEAAEKIVNITSDNSNNGLNFSNCIYYNINYNMLLLLQ
jgi:hypothetical protein